MKRSIIKVQKERAHLDTPQSRNRYGADERGASGFAKRLPAQLHQYSVQWRHEFGWQLRDNFLQSLKYLQHERVWCLFPPIGRIRHQMVDSLSN